MRIKIIDIISVINQYNGYDFKISDLRYLLYLAWSEDRLEDEKKLKRKIKKLEKKRDNLFIEIGGK